LNRLQPKKRSNNCWLKSITRLPDAAKEIVDLTSPKGVKANSELAGKGFCPECGGTYKDNRTCQQIFDEFLALEFTEPSFYEVHFLTVACFMIQHRRYSDRALVWIDSKLRDYLDKGLSSDKIRAHTNWESSQENHKWKILRGPHDRKLPEIAWSKRISDVAYPENEPAAYCREITDWARSTREEMQVWLMADSSG
jgi:hypothetical protein